jgi:hypothetical protein
VKLAEYLQEDLCSIDIICFRILQLLKVFQYAKLGSPNLALTLSSVMAPAMKPDNALNMEATPFCMPNIVPGNECTVFLKMSSL